VPVHRRFVLAPALSALARPRLLSWGWDRLAKGLPRVERLRKWAGLSRLVSGRESAPLAIFADGETDMTRLPAG
jgi:hypothetical protein